MPAQDVLVIGLAATARLMLDTRGVVPNAPSVEAL
jgi:hypothetical protein